MELIRQGGDADIEAILEAMWYSDPSPHKLPYEQWRQQQFPQELKQTLEKHGMGESSKRAGHVSPAGADRLNSAFASLSVAPAVPEPDSSVALRAGTLRANAKEFKLKDPFHASVAQWSSMPGYTTNPYQPGAALFPEQGGSTSLYPYAAVNQSALLANQADAQAPPSPNLEEFRARLLSNTTTRNSALVMFPENSEQLILLLDYGDQDVLHWVFDAVLHDVHMVMGSGAGCAVFLALLRACERAGRFDELHDIALAAASSDGRGFLMGVANYEHGEGTLKQLIEVVAPRKKSCEPLIRCLISDGIMLHRKGPQLLRHFFSTLPDEYCKILIRLAVDDFVDTVSSEFGSISMLECFAAARGPGPEHRHLEEEICAGTVEMATRRYSNYFLQQVLKSRREHLKEEIRQRVLRNLVRLSMDRYGKHLVRVCFLETKMQEHWQLVRRLLAAFGRLRDNQLRVLVQGEHGNHVVSGLLRACIYHPQFLDDTVDLARRIQMRVEVREHGHVVQVMKLVSDVLSWQHSVFCSQRTTVRATTLEK